MRRLILKFCQRKTDDEFAMSRSLSRIRNLISEIEEIQRQGKQGSKSLAALDRHFVPLPEVSSNTPMPTPAFVHFKRPKPTVAADPFEEIANLVDLDTKRPEPAGAQSPGKVSVQLSGEVALSLQIKDFSETVELKQVGDMIEIRFADGKAFHIPFKAVS